MTNAPQKNASVKETDASTKDPAIKELSTEMPLSEKDEVKKAEDRVAQSTKKSPK